MTSNRKIQANRQNAQKSTGPRSTAGKSKIAKNAVKHGFSAVTATVTAGKLDERAGHFFAGFRDSLIDRERVDEIVALQDFLNRVRSAKAETLAKAIEAGDIGAALDEYRRIDRYERRAISRRKTVIRRLNDS
jgi:hypothetical protein